VSDMFRLKSQEVCIFEKNVLDKSCIVIHYLVPYNFGLKYFFKNAYFPRYSLSRNITNILLYYILCIIYCGEIHIAFHFFRLPFLKYYLDVTGLLIRFSLFAFIKCILFSYHVDVKNNFCIE